MFPRPAVTRPTRAQVVRAIDLIEGETIYLAATGGWTDRLAEAAVARTPREGAALLAAARMQPDVAEAPALAEVTLERGRPRPVSDRGAASLADRQPGLAERAGA